MAAIQPTCSEPARTFTRASLREAELAAAAFLARYRGRTLDAYRYDLRTFFQWAADIGLIVLAATRPHIEMYRTTLEERHLAASTIDCRLSTVCGFYRFAHIDGRIGGNPAQYVRARACTRPTQPAWSVLRSAHSSLPLSESTMSTPRSPSCWGSTACACLKRARRTSKISDSNAATGRSVSSAKATNPLSFLSSHGQPAPST